MVFELANGCEKMVDDVMGGGSVIAVGRKERFQSRSAHAIIRSETTLLLGRDGLFYLPGRIQE
jgi:hypothetical protein